jgi:hypothetical protein
VALGRGGGGPAGARKRAVAGAGIGLRPPLQPWPLAGTNGPIPFSGRWHVDDSRLCVTAEDGFVAGRLREGTLCRAVWRDGPTGALLIDHAVSQGRAC